ncbi:MAG: hypothetical protein V2A54_10540, partial [Bacteroidota bacterium]
MIPSLTYKSGRTEGWKFIRLILILIIFLLAVTFVSKASNIIERKAEEASKKIEKHPDGFFSGPCDTIFCTNGKMYKGEVVSVSKDAVLFWKLKRNSRKLKQIPIENVFSIGKAVGSEQMVYIQDTLLDEKMFSVEEMRCYIQGAKDARKYYHSPMSTIGGFFIGAAAASIGFWATPIPFLYTLMVHSTSTRRAFSKINERHAYTDIYSAIAKPPPKLTRKIGKELGLKNFNKINISIEQEYMDDY